ncbi:MAG: CvpA family protein [Clostridia bacterium]|nr:CvpA family protein [Clostridia bacterium]
MDPIKVDFSNKGKSAQKEIVIPPENAGLKIIIGLVLTVITAFIAYYVMLPALNLKDTTLYMYLGVVAASYVVFQALLSKALSKPEYTPYVKRRAIVPGICIGILIAVALVGYIVGSQFFRAKAYSRIIDVRTDSNFSEEIPEEDASSFSSIPRLDEDSASQIAARALGDLGEMGYVSQFTVYSENTQINYKGTPVRVAPLQYASIIKWFFNTKEGFPGYVIIDMANESAEFKTLENKIRYSPAEHFNKLLKRHLRFDYPTYLFADATFEIDDEGNPYWICARLDNTIGLFGGTDVIGAVVVKADSADGESKYYTVEEFKNDPELQWIDRVFDSDLIVQQYDYYGRYRNGFWNSILGQKNVINTTSGYNYIAKDDDVWMYTGVTSVTADQSIIGFVLVNQRTKEAVYYNVTGGTEASAQSAAEGRVKDLGYTATFPLLLNIGGEPTYFLSLKDVSSGSSIVQQYALINVKQYNNNKMGANGRDLSECLSIYKKALESTGIKVDINPEDVIDVANKDNTDEPGGETDTTTPAETTEEGTVTGKVAEIREAVKGGETYYYIKLDSSDAYYVISATKAEEAVILNKGDSVTIKAGGSGKIINADSLKIN